MEHDGLVDLEAAREDRVEARHWLLEDHRDVVATHVPDVVLRHLDDVLATKQDPSAGDTTRRIGDQPHHGQGSDTLTTARFSDEPERFSTVDCEGDTVDRSGLSGVGREVSL